MEIILADRDRPYLFLETVGPTRKAAARRHRGELRKVEKFVDPRRLAIREVYGGEAFQWSLFHLLKDGQFIREKLFPVSLYHVRGNKWQFLGQVRPAYEPVGLARKTGELAAAEARAITRAAGGPARPRGFKLLQDMARVIRSKNAGVNRLTFDVFFNSPEDYQMALKSNAFVREEFTRGLGIAPARFLHSYRADSCLAVKLCLHRDLLCGSPGDRDVFGAQQHLPLMNLKVPLPFYRSSR